MQIEEQKAAPERCPGMQVTKQGAFPGSGPPQDGHVFRQLDLWNDRAAGVGRPSMTEIPDSES